MRVKWGEYIIYSVCLLPGEVTKMSHYCLRDRRKEPSKLELKWMWGTKPVGDPRGRMTDLSWGTVER